jgi:hypothetical protein
LIEYHAKVLQAKRAYSEAFAKVKQIEKQPGVLEKAGRVGVAFKTLLTLGSTMAEVSVN